MRNITTIIIHCSKTPENNNFSIESLERTHKLKRLKKIGYHYVIYLDGSIHKGRDEKEVGAHTPGYNNSSIGICYIGGLGKNGEYKDTRTEQQKESLIKLIKSLKEKYPEIDKIVGHRDVSSEREYCPCFSVKDEYENI